MRKVSYNFQNSEKMALSYRSSAAAFLLVVALALVAKADNNETASAMKCATNLDCPNVLACMREKCADPCPGSCGVKALCSTVNHHPVCWCDKGTTGDPFTECKEFDIARI